MRIALVCPYAFDDPGGVQTHVRELAERLLLRGHEVEVLAPMRHGAAQAYVRAVGRPVNIRYNASNAPIDPRPWSRRAVGRALRSLQPHVVHVHEPLTPSTSMWATMEARAPVVATFHSGATHARLFTVAAPLLRRVARRLRVRIAVSEAAAAFAGRRIGGRFEIVPNGVDLARFSDAVAADLGPGPKLLFLGRLDARKGFPVALAAFTRLAAERPELRLIVMGDGPDLGAVQTLPVAVRARVTLLGAIPNVDIPAYLAACDLYLGTSMGGESFGMVLVEAMASGLPIVASRIPGYVEVVRDGLEAVLVPPGDPLALAAATVRVLEDPALSARLRAAGLERVKGYDWSTVVARLEVLYGEAVQTGPSSLR